MSQGDVIDFYAETYPEARAKFQLAVAQSAGQLTSYVHPGAVGPDHGTLAMDVGCFGAVDAPKAFLILSGTHGGEGYAGSAAQIALLRSGALDHLAPDTRVVLVHGINPYGFAHWTRTTENNVDLNRNFVDFSGRLPRNDAYLELHDALCPKEWTESSRASSRRAIDAWIAAHGQQAWMQSIMMGQYDEPTGLNYGGRAPEWSHRTLEAILAQHLPSVRKLAFIDWHTGLGQPGQPFFLCFNQHRDPNWERACSWWGRDRIETADGYDGAARPTYNGLIFYGVQRFVAPAEVTGAVIEFGTLPVQESFDQLRIDRWLKFGHTPDDPDRLAAMRRGVRDAFTPPDPAWRRGVVAHATEIQLQGLAGVAAW
ncbi:M14 family metallopeptidase [Variovorax sp. M-6]|uniref:M14 family metallopeptidase n=1 Tax=Variovorax sp. M-6 TaxID=3233041 RepID=UPI003F998693